MAGRNFGLTNIYLKLGPGMILLGGFLLVLGLLIPMDQLEWLWTISLVLIQGGVVVYVIGRIAKVISGMRSQP